jgi:hypothetical protein
LCSSVSAQGTQCTYTLFNHTFWIMLMSVSCNRFKVCCSSLTDCNPSVVIDYIFRDCNDVRSSCCCESATSFTVLFTDSSVWNFNTSFCYILLTHNIFTMSWQWISATHIFLVFKTHTVAWTLFLDHCSCWIVMFNLLVHTTDGKWWVNWHTVLLTVIYKSLSHTNNKCMFFGCEIVHLANLLSDHPSYKQIDSHHEFIIDISDSQ